VRFDKIAPADMFSPIVSTTPAKTRAAAGPSTSKASPSKTKTLLAHNDFCMCPLYLPSTLTNKNLVPVYDARKTDINFDSDLGRLSTVLPAFTGEIPFSSFVIVGYSVSCYSGRLGSGEDKVAHVRCNILWAIVCGTPVLKKQ